MRVDHPNNVKIGGVCAYVGESLPVRNFSNSYLSQCLTFELTIHYKKAVIALYRSPSQTSDEPDCFSSTSEKLLINIKTCDPHFMILLCDSNAKSKFWLVNDTTTGEDIILENLTFLHRMN